MHNDIANSTTGLTHFRLLKDTALSTIIETELHEQNEWKDFLEQKIIKGIIWVNEIAKADYVNRPGRLWIISCPKFASVFR